MARKDDETPRRRRKKKPKEPPVKAPVKKKSSPLVTISVLAAAIALIWAAFPQDKGKADSSKTVASMTGVLDQIYLGCTVYWYQKGSQYLCTQEIVDSLYNSKGNDIKVTVTTNKENKFSAIGRHVNSPIVMSINFEGDIFLKVKECEFNIDNIEISDVNLEDLEDQCTSSATPSPS